MDKFVVKSRGQRRPKPSIQEVPRSLKQATLQSLKRVVVVEEIVKSKAILSTPGQSADILLSELAKLRPKVPSVEVLLTTKLGVVLKKLTKHQDPRVVQSALNLVNSWKADIREKKTRKLLNVRCDAKTDRSRKDARKQILEAFKGSGLPIDSDELSNLGEEIEREVYSMLEKRTGQAYRNAVRKIVFSLRHRSDLRKQIIDRVTSVSTLVKANVGK